MKKISASNVFRVICVFALLAFTNVFAQSHCTKHEIDYFTCEIESTGKLMSICGSSFEAGSSPPWLQYRFGLAGKPELVYPAVKDGSFAKFELNYFHPREDHDVMDLRFISGSAKYGVSLEYYPARAAKARLSGGVSAEIGTRLAHSICKQPIKPRYLNRFHSLFFSDYKKPR
jgi:hypothetical protein